MNKKSHSISLRLSQQDIGYLEAIKGGYSTSHMIRILIREYYLKQTQMDTEANK